VSDKNSFCFPVRVYYEDTDAGGVVYYANYLRFLERARSEWLRALQIEQAELLEQGIAFVVRHVDLYYRAPARLDDALQVVTRIKLLKKASLTFSQTILSASQQLLLEGDVRIACVDIKQQRPVAIPKSVMEVLASVS